jgi:hypothetical protein
MPGLNRTTTSPYHVSSSATSHPRRRARADQLLFDFDAAPAA